MRKPCTHKQSMHVLNTMHGGAGDEPTNQEQQHVVWRYLTRVCRPCHFDTKADRCDLRSATRIAPPLMLQGTALPRSIHTPYLQRIRNGEAVTDAHPVRVHEVTRKCKLGLSISCGLLAAAAAVANLVVLVKAPLVLLLLQLLFHILRSLPPQHAAMAISVGVIWKLCPVIRDSSSGRVMNRNCCV